MISLVRTLRALFDAVRAVMRDPETRALPFVAAGLVLTGTIVYWRIEDWNLIQALYFSVVSLTTVGYGDLHPTSDGSRLFTIVYILLGIGVLVAFLTSVAQQYIKQRAERPSVRDRVGELRQHRRAD